MLALDSRIRAAIAMALVALLVPTMAVAATAPNIVVVLADDLDQTLGSAGLALNKTREIIGGNGATAKNWFAHTPICCPSRAEILTGPIFPQPANCLAARPRVYAHKRFSKREFIGIFIQNSICHPFSKARLHCWTLESI